MRKYLIGFIIAIISIIPILNVKAEELIYEYKYGGDTRTFNYDTSTKTLGLKSTQHDYIYDTVEHDYYIFLWYSSEFRLFQSDSPIIFDMSGLFINLVSDSTVYQTKFSWNGGTGPYIKTDKKTSIDALPKQNYVSWNQIKSNYDILEYNGDTYVGIYNLQNINDLQQSEYIFYEYDLINNNYYNINFYTDNFNSDYKYQIKFDFQNSFIDITNYLSIGNYSYTLTKNSTLYMQVLNANDEIIETKTMTFADITYNEEQYLPTADINVNYFTDKNNMAKANIEISINNYSQLYYYKYSFNDIEDINIDIVDNKYSFETYQNGIIYFYIYNASGDIVYETSKNINQIIDNGIYYYYEFEMSEFYNSEDNSINTLVFYYKDGETLENNHNVMPYFNFYLMGEDNRLVPFYITYSRNLLDVNSYSRNINFDNITSQFLPYEKIFNNDSSYNNNSYTAFAIAPYMDLTNYSIEDYNDYKLVIRTTKKISDNYFNFVGGVMLPQPIINNNINYESEYTGLIKMFKKAFNRFKSVIIEIFQHCTYFFNNVSPIIQDFFITVFVLILFVFLIRFIL